MDEISLRIIYAGFFFLFIIISAAFRVKANKQGDLFNIIKKEGVAIAVTSRIIGLSLTSCCVLYIFVPTAIAFAHLATIYSLYIVGIIFCVISFPLIIWTFQSLGKNITETVEMRKSNELVTTGIYRYMRHPIYTTTFIYNFGLAIIAANWLIAIIVVSLFVVMLIRTITEEKILIEKYGDDYRNYMKRTGGHFPKLF